MSDAALSNSRIKHLLNLLNEYLKKKNSRGEIYLVGGAVMCLAFHARQSTKDLDAVFAPSTLIRQASAEIAEGEELPSDWLNDSVKGFLSPQGTFTPYLELSHLKILTATPEYLLSMKCLAMRLGAEYHDENDVRYLLRYLNIEQYERALEVITTFYPLERFPQKTIYALEEILADAK
jgi:hypothetical protein